MITAVSMTTYFNFFPFSLSHVQGMNSYLNDFVGAKYFHDGAPIEP